MIVLIAGCGPRYSVAPEPPLRSASLRDLLDRLDRRTQSIQTLKALMKVSSEKQPGVTSSLLFSRSTEGVAPSLRLKGFDPFGGTLFDLVWSNNRVWLSIPSQGRVLESTPDKRGVPSLPAELGLEVAELRLAVSAVVGPFMESEDIPVLEQVGSNYLIHVIRITGGGGQLTKRLWIERNQFRLVREEIFEQASAMVGPNIAAVSEDQATVVEYLDYQPRSVPAGAEIEWPDRLVITKPRAGAGEEHRLELKFLEVHPNAAISSEEYRIP
jgi:hypothetical protein